MLRLKFLAGLFEHPYADPDEAERRDEHRRRPGAGARGGARVAGAAQERQARAAARPREGQASSPSSGPTRPTCISAATARTRAAASACCRDIKDKAGPAWRLAYAEGTPHHRRAGQTGATTRSTAADPAKNAQRIAEAVKVATHRRRHRRRHRHQRIDVARGLCRQPSRRRGHARSDRQPAGAGRRSSSPRASPSWSC